MMKDGFIIIEIEDNGVGIPSMSIDKVVELFYNSKEVGKRTGIGLSICREIVENNDGELTFESEYKSGSKFPLRFPCA